MPVWRPFTKLNLHGYARLDPHAVFHFLPCQRPLRALLFWQVDERAGIPKTLKYFLPSMLDKTISNFRGIVQFAVLVVANNNRIERIVGVRALDLESRQPGSLYLNCRYFAAIVWID